MTDPPRDVDRPQPLDDVPASGPDAFETRLERHFASEVRRAERDVRREWLTRPVSTVGPRQRQRTWLAGVGAIVVAVVLAAGALGLPSVSVKPAGASPTAPSSAAVASVAPTPSAVVADQGTYLDGIPKTINGEPVLRGAAITDHIDAVADLSPFLVAGYPMDLVSDCLIHSRQKSPDPGCGNVFHLADAIGQSPSNALPLVHENQGFPDTGTVVVLRVHAHDVNAVARDRSEEVIVVEAVLWRDGSALQQPSTADQGSYPDGIPTTINGEPVLRGAAIFAHIPRVTDDSPFLVAGYASGMNTTYDCFLPSPLRGPLDPGCGGTHLTDHASDPYSLGGPILNFTSPLLRVDPGQLTQGTKVVLQVHAHDVLATGCDRCQSVLVVEAILWLDGKLIDQPSTANLQKYPDGIPMTIGGEPVVRPAEAAARVVSATDDTPFLLGGWFRYAAMRCQAGIPPGPPAPFLDCNGNFIQESGTLFADGLAVTPPTSPLLDSPGPVVLEVHTHDPRSSECAPARRPTCSSAVIVDRIVWQASGAPAQAFVETRFPDGIPVDIGGETVLRPEDAIARMKSATDATTFLVGGWRRGPVAYSCPLRVPMVQLLPSCAGYAIDDAPVPGPTEAQIRLVSLGVGLPSGPGPAVFRVHVRDPSAALPACPLEERTLCEGGIVVDEVVWTGDDATKTTPLTIQDVIQRLSGVRPAMSAAPFDPSVRALGACDPGWPSQAWTGISNPAMPSPDSIGRILVFPTEADAKIVAPNLRGDGGYTGTWVGGQPTSVKTVYIGPMTCVVSIDGARSSTWVVQENVIVEVTYPAGSPPAFVGRVRAALATQP